MEKKIMVGFDHIHYATSAGTPKLIEGAKSIECEFSFETTPFYADNRQVASFTGFAGGEGTLTILGLTKEEIVDLLGHTATAKGYKVNSNDQAPTVALMFRRKALDGTFNGYCIHNVKFNPTSISAETLEEGTPEEQPMELTFTAMESANGDIYLVDEDINEDWFSKIPTGESTPS